MKRIFLILSLSLTISIPGYSWLYPEHRDIMLRAIRQLDPSKRKLLDQIWSTARIGNEKRLFVDVIDTAQRLQPQFIDYAAWPAISGDHSCSPENLVDIVLNSDWILNVAKVTAALKAGIAHSHNSGEIENYMREADMKLLRADPEYVSRAGANYAHFKLALPEINTSASDYMELCIKTGCPLNITGIYTWLHTSAMEMASLLSTPGLTDQQQRNISIALLANEAFAIHFLEDCFASGHVAGIWGDASQRKGTHDFYNASGFQVTTWDGKRMVLMGDAYMRESDEQISANAVRASLEQLLNLIEKKEKNEPHVSEMGQARPDTFSVCRNATMPPRNFNAS
ncbi:MAG: hypothetical protein WCL00_12680, partial [Bacteroidota bacterium]